MPASDILNPQQMGWDPEIQDNMNPNYGFTRKRAASRLLKKAIGGIPYTRETANSGHTFQLTWLSRSWLCVQRLKRYYEQYEDGFFTVIDWDGGGRHYVGRFTSEPMPTETSNMHWDVQQLQFEEVPQVAMLQYPNDWDNDAIRFYPFNDFGDQKLATNGTWTTTARGSGADAYTTMDFAGSRRRSQDDDRCCGEGARVSLKSARKRVH